MSEYTPTVGELRQAYVEASGASMAQESYYAEQVAEFERGIARIKADVLREAALEFAMSPHVNHSGTFIHESLARCADRTEEEAGQ